MAAGTEPRNELREYLGVFRAHLSTIVAVTLLVTFAALFVSFRRTPIYEAHAEVLVHPTATSVGSGLSLPQPPNMDTERLVLLSPAVADQVRRRVAPGRSPRDLLRNVKVAVAGDTEVLDVAYSSPSPSEAARLANAFAGSYVDYRTKQILDQYTAAAGAVQQGITTTRNQLSALAAKIAVASPSAVQPLEAERETLLAQLTVLSQRLLDLRATESTVQASGQVIAAAAVPTSPASPNKVQDGILAFGAGLVLAIGLVFVRERLDDRVKGIEDLEAQLDTSVVAAVPRIHDRRRRDEVRLIMVADPQSPVSEAYRTLATSVQYSASKRSLKTVMITSSLDGDGKSTTAANLSVALAQAGKRVILISADLRRPRLHEFFGMANDVGLGDVIAGSAQFFAALKTPAEVPNLRVIVSGHPPANPAAVLGSPQLADLLGDLRELADFIVVDTPPVLAVTDAAILAPIVDGTLFVVERSRSRRSAIQRAWTQLRTAGARLIGLVYISFDPSRDRNGYSYQYYSYRRYTGPTSRRPQRGRLARAVIRRPKIDRRRASGSGRGRPSPPPRAGGPDDLTVGPGSLRR